MLFAGLQGQAAQGARPLPERTMGNLVGGVCNTKCQNACRTQVKCGKCLQWQDEGELCPGGGGTGTAFRCVSARPAEAFRYECFLQGGDSKCKPAKICTCDNASPPACTERNNTEDVSGNGACVTGVCSS